MKQYISYIFTFSMILAATPGSLSADHKPRLVPVGASQIYIPIGFDDNDNIQVVIEGFFPNTCYKLAPAFFGQRKDGIYIQPQAYLYRGPCLAVIVPYEQVVDLGLADKGTYEVWIGGKGGGVSATLEVAAAQNDEGPDNYLYAPVTTAHRPSRAERMIRLRGIFPNRCMQLDRVVILNQPAKHVVALLPIAKMNHLHDDWECGNTSVPFEVDVNLNKEDLDGRLLIHIRSLNGKSVNLIEDF